MNIVDRAIKAKKINDDLWDEGILGASSMSGVHCNNEIFVQVVKEHEANYNIREKYIDDLTRLEAEINDVVFFTLANIEEVNSIKNVLYNIRA